MNRKERNDLHQRRRRIVRRSQCTAAVEFFNVLTSDELLQTTEVLLGPPLRHADCRDFAPDA